MIFLKSFALLYFIIVLTETNAVSYENIFGDRYGKEWVFITDEEGLPHFLNMTEQASEDKNNNESRQLKAGGVDFYLYTRGNQNDSERLIPENEKVNSQHFNPKNNLKVVTHGWLSSGSTQWLLDMKDTYLKTDDQNFVAVDWSQHSKTFYIVAARNTDYVGKEVAKLLDALRNSYDISGKDMHLIGHSLGAHVMGYAGSYVKQPVSRVTGLDPARPLFEIPQMTSDNKRLDKSDAEFVDIIHSCAGVLGYKYSHGHADFYPNSGEPAQPGCGDIQTMLEGCSHGRSYEYYRESIETRIGFYSYPCDDYDKFNKGECRENPQMMGAHLDKSSRGDYYLNTNAEPEYAQGKQHNE